MWTDPKHIVQWWGPAGFSNTVEVMDVRPGGIWRHVMHGPDGRNFPNESVYVEVVKDERLVYDHASEPHFRATATFADEAGKTRVTLRMVFRSADSRDRVVKAVNAIEGANQTLARLADHLATVST